MKITTVQIFDYPATNDDEGGTYSANIFTSEGFVIQIGTDGQFSIPLGHQCYCTTEEIQDAASEDFCEYDIAKKLGLFTEMAADELRSIALDQGAAVE